MYTRPGRVIDFGEKKICALSDSFYLVTRKNNMAANSDERESMEVFGK